MTAPLVPLRVPMIIIAPNGDTLMVTYTDKIIVNPGYILRHSKANVRRWMREHRDIHNKKSNV